MESLKPSAIAYVRERFTPHRVPHPYHLIGSAHLDTRILLGISGTDKTLNVDPDIALTILSFSAGADRAMSYPELKRMVWPEWEDNDRTTNLLHAKMLRARRAIGRAGGPPLLDDGKSRGKSFYYERTTEVTPFDIDLSPVTVTDLSVVALGLLDLQASSVGQTFFTPPNDTLLEIVALTKFPDDATHRQIIDRHMTTSLSRIRALLDHKKFQDVLKEIRRVDMSSSELLSYLARPQAMEKHRRIERLQLNFRSKNPEKDALMEAVTVFEAQKP